jgi:hypothetical protein
VGGGIGIAACGTGIGIPVGVVILAGTAIGAGIGALCGAASGKSDTYVLVEKTSYVKVFPGWLGPLSLFLAAVSFLAAFFWKDKAPCLAQ